MQQIESEALELFSGHWGVGAVGIGAYRALHSLGLLQNGVG